MKLSLNAERLFAENRFNVSPKTRHMIGANIASVMGISPWLSRTDYFLRLTNRIPKPPRTKAMNRGTKFESSVATMFRMTHRGSHLLRKNPIIGKRWVVNDPAYPFLGGRPDRMVLDSSGDFFGGLEIKTTGQSVWNFVPEAYALQCLFYAGLCGCCPWTLSVLFFKEDEDGKDQPYLIQNYHLPFDAGIFTASCVEAKDFWRDNVEKDNKPAPFYSEQEWFNEKMKEYCEKRIVLIDQASIHQTDLRVLSKRRVENANL